MRELFKIITVEPTMEMLENWKAIWEKHKNQLTPNRKSGAELLEYLKAEYTLTEIQDKEKSKAISDTILSNNFQKNKLPHGKMPCIKMYYVENIGKAKTLYLNQDFIFKDIKKIFVSIDLISGCYSVEGSSLLWDTLCVYQGLDQSDIKNPVCVAQYIECMENFELDMNNKTGMG